MQEYTREEVLKHNTKESCWVIIDHNVYDMTNYLTQHPPGANVILNVAQKGSDAGGMYRIHSPKAKAMWNSFKIGTLKD